MNQVPQPLDGPNKMGIVTPEGNLIVIDDDNGKLNLYLMEISQFILNLM